MADITILPDKITITAYPGETLRDVLLRAGVALETPCNGQGVCGQCLVRVDSATGIPETPHEAISSRDAGRGIRLACRLEADRDMTVQVLSIMPDDDEIPILEGTVFSGESTEDAIILKKTDFAVRLETESRGDGAVLRYEDACRPLSNWKRHFSPKGLAVDIGTTTLVGSLVCLTSGRILSTVSTLNPQIAMGHDVMTRIQKGSTADGLRELTEAVQQGIRKIIREVCVHTRTDPLEILDVVVGGNTAMLQITAGINPEPLGHSPFNVDIEGGREYPAGIFHLDTVNPGARVYVPPVAHAFVGSDISAGMLICEGFFNRDKTVLFIDIGTNGEIGLQTEDRVLITSTAAGPAFEGMGMSSGMRAGIGAVETVEVIDDRLRITTIGDVPPRGICGSGIIDMTAALLKLGVIDPGGRMAGSGDKHKFSAEIAASLCHIDEVTAFAYGENVCFTQKDIRQVQLAKSAIRTAVDIFIRETGQDIDEVVVAGGFGFTLNPDSLGAIGLLPRELAEKISFAGNSSLLGCQRMLIDVSSRRFIENRLAEAEHLSLAERPDFMMAFVENMEFV